MKNSWYAKKLEEYAKLGGYKKPEKFDDVLKLDSNENFVINKKFPLCIFLF